MQNNKSSFYYNSHDGSCGIYFFKMMSLSQYKMACLRTWVTYFSHQVHNKNNNIKGMYARFK